MAPLLLAAVLAGAPWTPVEGKELLGTPAPAWRGIRWIQGGPLTLAGLRGKVVLVRFWLMDCPYCAATAPALRELSDRYRDRGLVVVGIHHPKSEAGHDSRRIARAARALKLDFPIGTDNDWQTLRAYGVGTHFQNFTSLSFLIDAQGIIRFVHDGGEFHRGGGPEHQACNAAYEALEKTLEKVLADAHK